MPKQTRAKVSRSMRHNPLAHDILEEEANRGIRTVPRNKLRRADDDEDANAVVPSSVAKKVIGMVQAQKADEEDRPDDFPEDVDRHGNEQIDMEEAAEEIDVEVDEDGYIVAPNASDEDERAMALFLPGKSSAQAGPTLADIILQKIQEAEARKEATDGDGVASEAGLSPKVVQVYGDIGKWLKFYKSGAIPKAFKVIPNLTNWEEVLALTSPLTWSPAAMYQASVIFVSNLNPRMAQRFFNLVLLPAVRQDIAEHKKLNFHYYRALRKSLFKPAAFFKGILLPMAAESCTLREAVIMGSVLAKASVPVMHVAASIVRLCTMTPWYGTTAILLAAQLNKKYALPLKVIECLVAHFCAFAGEDKTLPLVWHRALLIFVQRYKFDLSADQKRRIKEPEHECPSYPCVHARMMTRSSGSSGVTMRHLFRCIAWAREIDVKVRCCPFGCSPKARKMFRHTKHSHNSKAALVMLSAGSLWRRTVCLKCGPPGGLFSCFWLALLLLLFLGFAILLL
ncbi:bysl [Symbiodinium necroappetens]|uniref:Bysl protein n=1 Tax=Symbiodinium necroappetens TaxID=1628268 RepID=A0A812SKR9_9DINO|nr:bysl [Symbiodinium necroappetens]